MKKEIFYTNLIKEIEPFFDYKTGHGIDHTIRVYNMALTLCKNYKVDLEVLKLSVLLHDIARRKESEDDKICHAIEGAKMARKILAKKKVENNKINEICKNIEEHRYSKGIIPSSICGKILQDADKLDALGAIIIARAFNYGGKHGLQNYNPNILPKENYISNSKESTTINHFFEKILNIKPDTFYTKEAQKIAKGRYEYTKSFVKRYIDEYNGKI